MFKMHTILVPVPDPKTFPGARRLLHQIDWLARRFQSEVLLLHVVTSFDYPIGMLEKGHEITERDMRAPVIRRAEEDLDRMSLPELAGITVNRLLLRGNTAREILRTATDSDAELIAMPSPDDPAFVSFLTGSVSPKVLFESVCPVWTSEPQEEAPPSEFQVRNILCSIDLTAHSRRTVTCAARVAAVMGARLTLIHITAGVEVWGPGGTHVDREWKETLTGMADEEIANLQRELGTQAEVIVDSGNVPELLNRAAGRIGADLLIVGRAPGRSHLGDNGLGRGIACESHIPVLSL